VSDSAWSNAAVWTSRRTQPCVRTHKVNARIGHRPSRRRHSAPQFPSSLSTRGQNGQPTSHSCATRPFHVSASAVILSSPESREDGLRRRAVWTESNGAGPEQGTAPPAAAQREGQTAAGPREGPTPSARGDKVPRERPRDRGKADRRKENTKSTCCPPRGQRPARQRLESCSPCLLKILPAGEKWRAFEFFCFFSSHSFPTQARATNERKSRIDRTH
jgi:hypothetical protein